MNANEMTFGIEIECLLPQGLVRCGGYHRGVQIPALPPGWNAQSDCSIRSERGMQGVEIVSPILKGADGIKQVLAVCKWLQDNGAKVNDSTGFHVHVGWNGDTEALDRLVHSVAGFETALYAATGTRKRSASRFCRPIHNDEHFVAGFKNAHSPSAFLAIDRYHTLNIANLNGNKQTVEFRVFAGTTNAVKIISYIRLCLGIVEKAMQMKRSPKWDGHQPASGHAAYRKGGQGETKLALLFYWLGWTKGRESSPYGNVGDESDDSIPTLKAGKKELLRLAKKFDAAGRFDAAND